MGKIIEFARRRAKAIMAARAPDFVVGEESDPYLRRWRITPKWAMRLGAIYLHEFCRDDEVVPHDHPYAWCVSWVLEIGYYENRFRSDAMDFLGRDVDYRDHMAEPRWLAPGAMLARWGWTPHRVTLKRFNVIVMGDKHYVIQDGMAVKNMVQVTPHPISLFFCGPRVREWGFWCPNGWRKWTDYIAPTSYGNRVGKGCAD